MLPDRPNPDRGAPDRGNPDRGNPDRPNQDRVSPDRPNPDHGSPDRPSQDRANPERLVAQYGSALEWQDRTPLTGDIITCDFRVFGNGGRDDTTGEPAVWTEEAGPKHVTFAGLRTSRPRVKDDAGEGSLSVLRSDSDETVLYDTRTRGKVFSYAISRRLRMAIWTKVSFVRSEDFAYVSVGRCY